MSIACPRCNTVNQEGSVFCISCGGSLEGLAPSNPVPPVVQPSPIQNQGPVSSSAPIMITTRYKTLRAISTFLSVLAWIFLVAGALGGVIAAISNNGGALLVVLFFLGGILAGGIVFAMFKAYAELLHLAIDIEENTRRTAELLKQR